LNDREDAFRGQFKMPRTSPWNQQSPNLLLAIGSSSSNRWNSTVFHLSLPLVRRPELRRHG
jgi:hypothetical protein